MKGIEIDRNKQLWEEPDKGHNRWHPDIPPALEVEPGEVVVIETRGPGDGQVRPSAASEQLESMRVGGGHALTGPVYIPGCQPRRSAGNRVPRHHPATLRVHHIPAWRWLLKGPDSRLVSGPLGYS